MHASASAVRRPHIAMWSGTTYTIAVRGPRMLLRSGMPMRSITKQASAVRDHSMPVRSVTTNDKPRNAMHVFLQVYALTRAHPSLGMVQQRHGPKRCLLSVCFGWVHRLQQPGPAERERHWPSLLLRHVRRRRLPEHTDVQCFRLVVFLQNKLSKRPCPIETTEAWNAQNWIYSKRGVQYVLNSNISLLSNFRLIQNECVRHRNCLIKWNLITIQTLVARCPLRVTFTNKCTKF